MIALLQSEFFKLRTLRLNYLLLIIGIAFVVVIIGLIGIFADVDQSGSTPSSDIADIIGGTAILPGLLISVIGVLAISSEFAHGTIRPTLVATPSRPKVFLAKAIVLVVVAALSAVVIALVGYVVGYVLLSSRGAEELTFLDRDGTVSVLFVGLPILFVMLVLFGYGLGLLIRNSPAAVSLAILWPILIETILAGSLTVAGVDDVGRFLPYQSALVLVATDPSSGDFAYGKVASVAFFGIVVVALVGSAMAVNNKRDV